MNAHFAAQTKVGYAEFSIGVDITTQKVIKTGYRFAKFTCI